MTTEHDELAVAQTSLAKVHALVARVGEIEVTGGVNAMLLGAFTMALPQLLSQLPEDPRELDELIDRGREFLATLQSDPGAVIA